MLTLLSCGVALGQTITDDFSRYSPESDGGPAWEPEVPAWTVVEGGYVGEEAGSVWRAAPWARAVRFAIDQ